MQKISMRERIFWLQKIFMLAIIPTKKQMKSIVFWKYFYRKNIFYKKIFKVSNVYFSFFCSIHLFKQIMSSNGRKKHWSWGFFVKSTEIINGKPAIMGACKHCGAKYLNNATRMSYHLCLQVNFLVLRKEIFTLSDTWSTRTVGRLDSWPTRTVGRPDSGL